MTVRDDSGNVCVDFVWGNLPMQPDDDRSDETVWIPQVEDNFWSQAHLYISDTLNPNLDNHSIATTGYSNFPQFIENYAGDGDPQPEIKIPNLVRQTLTKAQDLIDPFNLNLFAVSHRLTASYVETNGKTVRVTAYDHQWNNWGGGYPDSQLIGLKVGDQVTATLDVDGSPFSFTDAKITAINVDGTNSWFEFKTDTATDPAIDFAASGYIYAGANIVNKVTLQRSEIRNPGQQVNVRYVEAP